MEAFAVLCLKALILGGLGFLAAALLKMKEPLLTYVGAGWLGWKVGEWAGELVGVHDPTTIRVRAQETPLLLSFGGALVVMLLARLVRRRKGGRA